MLLRMSRRVIFQVLAFGLAGALLAMCGCGAPPTSSAPPPATPNGTLAGNWLLFGQIPGLSASSTSSGMVAGFSVINNTIIASATLQGTCSNSVAFGATFGGVLTGAIAADGTFTASAPALPSPSGAVAFTIQGKVPATAGTPWNGSYTYTDTNTLCPASLSGAFTATHMGDVTGTYSGTGSLAPVFGSATGTPVTLSMMLQQGATLYGPSGAAGYSNLALNGTVQVSGISCFTKGQTSTVLPSVVEGSRVLLEFTMDDGSTMQVLGGILNMGATQLGVQILEVKSGQCAGIHSFSAPYMVVSR